MERDRQIGVHFCMSDVASRLNEREASGELLAASYDELRRLAARTAGWLSFHLCVVGRSFFPGRAPRLFAVTRLVLLMLLTGGTSAFRAAADGNSWSWTGNASAYWSNPNRHQDPSHIASASPHERALHLCRLAVWSGGADLSGGRPRTAHAGNFSRALAVVAGKFVPWESRRSLLPRFCRRTRRSCSKPPCSGRPHFCARERWWRCRRRPCMGWLPARWTLTRLGAYSRSRGDRPTIPSLFMSRASRWRNAASRVGRSWRAAWPRDSGRGR